MFIITYVENVVINGDIITKHIEGSQCESFFVRFYAISGVCTQKCASCDCINFLVIMKVSHHGSKASLGNSFVLI